MFTELKKHQVNVSKKKKKNNSNFNSDYDAQSGFWSYKTSSLEKGAVRITVT